MFMLGFNMIIRYIWIYGIYDNMIYMNIWCIAYSYKVSECMFLLGEILPDSSPPSDWLLINSDTLLQGIPAVQLQQGWLT